MSQRTIVEFNHDYTYRIERGSTGFAITLRRLLNSGSGPEVNEALKFYGVTVTPTHHHADVARLTLTTNGGFTFFDEEV